jgi:hypothetical protein
MSKAVAELDERELLALAISLEEEDSRIYCHFRERLKKGAPGNCGDHPTDLRNASVAGRLLGRILDLANLVNPRSSLAFPPDPRMLRA